MVGVLAHSKPHTVPPGLGLAARRQEEVHHSQARVVPHIRVDSRSWEEAVRRMEGRSHMLAVRHSQGGRHSREEGQLEEAADRPWDALGGHLVLLKTRRG